MLNGMDLTDYRNEDIEKARTSDLMSLIPNNFRGDVLDVGARDGWFSIKLAEKFDKVIALDLEQPSIKHPKVQCVKGDAQNLDFGDSEFDFVFCAEVLEHIPTKKLKKVCSELQRVSKKYILVGVPFKQDTRIGQTKCYTCGRNNPPWGHFNSFDERRLNHLFSSCRAQKKSFVGKNKEFTNTLSVFLMDFSGNPYGTYIQEEPCVHCGAKLKPPPQKKYHSKNFYEIGYLLK